MAIVRIAGNRRRTTESNSKPDIFGILRSERSNSGTSFRISRNAEKPSSAERARYPLSVSASDSDNRTVGSSSTMSSVAGVAGIFHPANTAREEVWQVFHSTSCYAVQFNTVLAGNLLTGFGRFPSNAVIGGFSALLSGN